MNLFRSTASLLTDTGWLCLESEGGVITRAWFSDEAVKEGDADPVLINAMQQLQEYLTGKRIVFDLPLQPAGTVFQQKVWKALMEVKCGTTYSYKEFSARISDAKSVRAVATAIGANPVAVLIPCHRIIGSQGNLTGYAWGIYRKEWLLHLEQGAYTPSLFEQDKQSLHG